MSILSTVTQAAALSVFSNIVAQLIHSYQKNAGQSATLSILR
jgi:hypothetical protein